jgi:hypothetical protein
MFNFTIDIQGLKNLENHVKFVTAMAQMKEDKKFQDFIKDKCLKTVIKKANEMFAINTTTNEDLKEEYLKNNKIRDEEGGFVVYNNLCITKETTRISKGYTFCVALAFEYGTGIIGSGSVSSSPDSYKYNVNNNKVKVNDQMIDGWWLSKQKNANNPYVAESKSGNAVVTQGYSGMEIYRKSVVEIEKSLNNWVNEYFNKFRKGV